MKISDVYALALLSIGHVMIEDGVTAREAWSPEYTERHEKWLIQNAVPPEALRELLETTAEELFRRC